MAKLTEEQRRQRAAKRAQRTALDAEAEDRRHREQRELWKREGRRLSYAEYATGEPCRRWSISGSRVTHCGSCCPPPPMSPKWIEDVVRILASGPSREERKKDLDVWNLTLRCEHVVPFIQHREHTYVSTSVVDCPGCGQRRGVLSSERVGPAYTDDGTLRARTEPDRERLARELTAAEAKLVRQQKDAAATQRRTTEIQEALNEES